MYCLIYCEENADMVRNYLITNIVKDGSDE